MFGIKGSRFLRNVKVWFNKGYKDVPMSYLSRETEYMNGLKANIARSWMKEYFKAVGEKMPYGNQVLLPSFMNKKFVFTKLKEDIIQTENECISYSRVCKLWCSEFSYVKIPAVSSIYVQFCYNFLKENY